MSETWKPCPGFEGHYEVSDKGRVRSLVWGDSIRKKPLVLHSWRYTHGNRYVTLRVNGHVYHRSLIRLVAKAFLNMPDNLVAYPKNGCKLDCCVENIGIARSYTDVPKHNNQRIPVRKVRRDTGEVVEFYSSMTEAAAANYMSKTGISDRCKKVRNYDHEEYTFEFDK